MTTELAELDRYDRQIRAWGFETQQKLHECRFLFSGVNHVSYECMKNLILAGASEVDITDSKESMEQNSTQLGFLISLNPYCNVQLIPLETILHSETQICNEELLSNYAFICIFNNNELLINHIKATNKAILIHDGVHGDLIHLQPDYHHLFQDNSYDPLEQTIIGSLLSQMIVDHLPPLHSPMHYRLLFNSEQLSSSVQQIV